MMRNMANPFKYGSVVTSEAFCNRRRELADVTLAMKNSDKLFIYSERRYGKTSLVNLALDRLPKRSYYHAYVDLWPTDDGHAFVVATARAITEATATTAQKMLETAKAFFSQLVPRVTVDNDGQPQVEFGMRDGPAVEPELREVLSAPEKIAKSSGRQMVVVYDEFQQILNYGNDLVERELLSVIQHQKNVAYLFLGSRKHLIREMFLEESRPLYRAAGHYPLSAISEEHWRPFIKKRFADAGKKITDDLIHIIHDRTEGHPFYTQHLCHLLWEMVGARGRVTKELLDESLRVLIGRESYAYTTLWESLTKNQQRLLKGLASEPPGCQPYSSDFTRRYGLRSASNAQRAVEPLLERDIIDRDNGSFLIIDRFLRWWIQREILQTGRGSHE